MRADIEELMKAVSAFRKAEQKSELVIHEIETTVENLEKHWEDANQQRFYEYYQEWHQQMHGLSYILKAIADQIEAIAEDYHKAAQ